MKKTICLFLTLVMVLLLSTVVFADDVVTIGSIEKGSNTATLQIAPWPTFTTKGNADIVYCLKIEWTADDSIYIGELETNYVWNIERQNYVPGDKILWYAPDGYPAINVQITLTNLSNADVGYKIEYTDLEGDDVTTAEAPKESGTDLPEGTLERADQFYVGVGAVADDPGEGHDYVIVEGNLSDDGIPSSYLDSVTYNSVVTITGYGENPSIFHPNNVLGLKYIITLSKPDKA